MQLSWMNYASASLRLHAWISVQLLSLVTYNDTHSQLRCAVYSLTEGAARLPNGRHIRCCVERVMDPAHQPAHSCKYCQRMVLRPENFVDSVCRIEIPYTSTEIQSAVKDGCALFQLFFCAEGSGGNLTIQFALEDSIKRQISANTNRSNSFSRKVRELHSLRKARRKTGKFYLVISSNEGQFNLPSGKVVFLQYERIEMHRTCMSIKASPGSWPMLRSGWP
jgi:hypothetical protein